MEDLENKLTDTQKEYLLLLREHGYILVTEGEVYATYFIRDKQISSSSFNALREHGFIKLIDLYKSPNRLIYSVWTLTDNK